MIRALALLLLCALPACSDHPPLGQASGPLRPLNPGRWTPSDADLRLSSSAWPASLTAEVVQ